MEAKIYWECKWKNKTGCKHYDDAALYEEMLPAPWFTNITDYFIEKGLVKD